MLAEALTMRELIIRYECGAIAARGRVDAEGRRVGRWVVYFEDGTVAREVDHCAAWAMTCERLTRTPIEGLNQ